MTRTTFSGARLRAARKRNGIPKELVALAAGRSTYSINEYESGRVVPPLPTLAAIADFLGEPVEEFFEPVEVAP